MNKIQAVIVADSVDTRGNRITSFLLTYPRFIHSELMTHRMFSRNSASSRAIPFEKMVKMVEEDPFIPIAWQKSHVGMQGNDYIQTDDGLYVVNKYWLEARDKAVKAAKDLHSCDITKQLCNRVLEPFMWHTTLITATEFSNFFELRCSKYDYMNVAIYKSRKDAIRETKATLPYDDWYSWQKMNKSQAEIHIQALAEAMWDARNESTPKHLEEGQWHLPFNDKLTNSQLEELQYKLSTFPEGMCNIGTDEFPIYGNKKAHILVNNAIQTSVGIDPFINLKLKINVARAARLSYNNHNGEIDYEKDIKLHNQLLASHHMSPFEHVARVMNDDEYDSFFRGRTYVNQNEPNSKELNNFYIENGHGWCDNFRGFIPYRYLIENEKI